jgi:histidine triad (HIT) family protein
MAIAKQDSYMACIFCRIVAGSAPAQVVYRDEIVTAFRDTHPIAPVHVLVVPNLHLTSLNDSQPEHEAIFGHMVQVARLVAEQEHVQLSGYRLVINTGPDAGQSVLHVHLHVLGGRPLPFRFE